MGRSWSGRRSGNVGQRGSSSFIQFFLLVERQCSAHPYVQLDMSQKRPGINPQFLAIGIAIGVAIGIAMHNVGVGIAIGIAIGVAMGAGRGRR